MIIHHYTKFELREAFNNKLLVLEGLRVYENFVDKNKILLKVNFLKKKHAHVFVSDIQLRDCSLLKILA